MSFLWLSDLVRLVLKEIYCRMSKELHWSLDCFKLLKIKNMSCIFKGHQKIEDRAEKTSSSVKEMFAIEG